MMYKKNFVAAIKVGGKVLRESSEEVKLPFGSEYSILLKNLDTVRMQAKIDIDGKPAVSWVVLYPGQEVEIERYLSENGNLSQGNKFKFIERTEQIENHRGVRVDDGLVRIEFKKEKLIERPKLSWTTGYSYSYSYPYYAPFLKSSWSSGIGGQSTGMRSGQGAENAIRGHQMMAMNNVQCSVGAASQTKMVPSNIPNEAGITVQGGLSNQRFYSVPDFETEAAEAVVLHLVGKVANKKVAVAKTIQTKLECETCGHTSKSNAKFCKQCGTSLEKF